MKRFSVLILILSSISFALNDRDKSEFRTLVADKDNFECAWDPTPFTLDVEGELIHVGQSKCKYLPKTSPREALSAAKPTKRMEDKTFVSGCKAEPTDTPAPSPEVCELRNDKSEPSIFSRAAYVVEQKALPPRDAEALKKDFEQGRNKYGVCTYSNAPASIGTGMQYKDGFAFVCSTPVNCVGGKTVAPTMAICSVAADAKTVPTMNAATKEMENVAYPVCPPAEACLIRGERDPKIKVVQLPKNATNAVSHRSQLRAKRSESDNQIASTYAPSGAPLLLKGGVTHVIQ